jgi:hypothetical protein
MPIPIREINVEEELKRFAQLLEPHRDDRHPAVSLAIKHFDALVLSMKLAKRADEDRIRAPQEGTILLHLEPTFGSNGPRLLRLPIAKIHKLHVIVNYGGAPEMFQRIGGIHLRKGHSRLGRARLDGAELAALNKKLGEGDG